MSLLIMTNIDDNKDHWETRMWFRLSKVVYYLFLFLVILFVCVYAYSVRPTSSSYTDSNKTIIKCNNGKTYNAKENGFFLVYYSDVDTGADKILKILCEYGISIIKDITKANQFKNKIPQSVNYQIEFVETTNIYGSWEEVLLVLLVGIPVTIVVFEIVKRLFLYITIGKNPLKIR